MASRSVKTGRKKGKIGKTAGISEKELSIFGLTSIEARIVLCLLERGHCGVSSISRAIDIPHTSVHSAIRRLGEQGFVRRVSKGYASVWKVVGLEKIRPKISKALKPFGSEFSKEELEEYVGAKASDREDFQVFREVEPILRVFQWFFLNHRGENVREIQGANSLKQSIHRLGGETTAQLSDFMVTNQIHTDLVMTQSSRDTYGEDVVADLRLATSLRNRIITSHLIPDEYFKQSTHTMIASNAAIIVNWDETTLELVKESNFLKLLTGLFENLKKNGQFFDYSAYIQHLIEERGKA